ncbi:dihydrodipicolinate synthase family protein [Opitutaceae bacterium]
MSTRLAGVIPILATPFHDDESLDLESLHGMIGFYRDLKVDGVTVLGILGESNRLTDSERTQLIKTAVRAADGLPVIVGTSHTGTSATIALGHEAANLGAAAVMVAPSKQPTPSDAAVFEYYRRVASQSTVPVVLQDHPLSTEVHMSVDLMLRITRELPAVTCIKAEAAPSPQRIAALKAGLAGRDVTVLTGLSALYGYFDLERGSDGFNAGFAFPEVLIALVRAARAGDFAAALRIYTRYLPLIVFEQQPGLAIRKEVLRIRKLITSHRVRHPGATIDAATATQLKALLDATFPGQDLTKPVLVEA